MCIILSITEIGLPNIQSINSYFLLMETLLDLFILCCYQCYFLFF